MNLIKSIEYFNPGEFKDTCHIIGCGSVGSSVAELLARLGLTRFVLYDFDTVEGHNIANQQFTSEDIGTLKVDAVGKMICKINPEAKGRIQIYDEGYTGQTLNGYVFLCVDNIELRKEICEKNRQNRQIKGVFDFRTRLEDAQHYAADWGNLKQVKRLINSMDFTHEEAQSSTPKSACGVELGVAPTVRMVCDLGVANFLNLVRGQTDNFKQFIACSPFLGYMFGE